MADFNFKVSLFGFMDMLKFKKIVPLRREKLAGGENTPLTGTSPAIWHFTKCMPRAIWSPAETF